MTEAQSEGTGPITRHIQRAQVVAPPEFPIKVETPETDNTRPAVHVEEVPLEVAQRRARAKHRIAVLNRSEGLPPAEQEK